MRKNLIFTPLMVMLAAGGLTAQDTSTAVLTGRVTSQNNQPLAGVNILISSPSMLSTRQATTDAGGNFRVSLLPNGEYTITYTLNGYLTRKLTLRLVAGTTANGSIKLNEINVQQEEVEIVATNQITAIDKTETVVQTAFSVERMDAITGRSLNAISSLAAGMVTTGNINSGTSSIYIRGGSGRGAKTLLDGTSVTEQGAGYNFRLNLVEDLIESVAVIQSPLNSRYGNTDGGLLSMVTSKGSNTFTGTLRVNSINRSYWSYVDQYSYPRRDGTSTVNPVNTNDLLSKNYEFSLQGPIWKDHITFAYGTKLTPTNYYLQSKGNILYNWGSGSTQGYYGQYGRPYDTVGTFFQAPNGDVVRRAELFVYEANKDGQNGIFPASSWNEFNQFTVYAQITPSHSVEYSWHQDGNVGKYDNDMLGYVGTDELENNNYSVQKERAMGWNLSYKGLIGKNGILEARYAKRRSEWVFGTPGNNPDPIIVYGINSYIPIDKNGDLGSFDNYWSNGILWSNASQGNMNSYGLPGYEFNQWTGRRAFVHNGLQAADGDGGESSAIVLNYQHYLDTNKGNHLIDVGFQNDDYKWQKKADAPGRTRYRTAGLISRDLRNNEVYNINTGAWGTGNGLSQYAGMYIVWNMRTAMLSDIDPWSVNVKGIRDAKAWQPEGISDYQHPLLGSMVPMVELRSGEFPGYWDTITNSFYINDLWTINDHHSVMAGVRIDNYELTEGSNSRLSYMVPTLRAEYKWDMYGDQRRLFNLSFGQFHTSLANNMFSNLFPAPSNDVQEMLWDRPNPDGSNRPYLVTKDEFLDLSNYGLIGWASSAAGSQYDVDSDWKAPISNEISVGFRSNLSGGGFLKASYVYRFWQNDGLGFYMGEIFDMKTGIDTTRKTFKRVLRNADGYERTYKGLELEWELPLNKSKRVIFGGNWTWSRLLTNDRGLIDTPSGGDRSAAYWDDYLDHLAAKWGGRKAWNPVGATNSEHRVNFYFLFNLTSGRIISHLTLRGDYTSAGPVWSSWGLTYGYPADFYPELKQLIVDKSGGTISGTSGTDGLPTGVSIPWERWSTGADGWNMNLRYTLTVPLVRKVSWLATVSVGNPFNHRGKSGWAPPGFSGSATPFDWSGNVSRPANLPYGGIGDDLSTYVPRSSGDLNGLYQGRQGGRSMSFQTGLRF
ncbi:MAG: carboxypeptidase regulatory-like domain-containing protein [Holophagales bacterium]|jgi:hypothetical protein|nr:carboxypeptidase regulatory-like domain-containing protein [Holophagales bacterium]